MKSFPSIPTSKWFTGNRTRIVLGLASSVLGLGVLFFFQSQTLFASDHDDGEVDTKGRNVNLTDLYVFREQDQNPDVKSDDLVLVMNTNPRSVARQQYFFSSNAQYDFKITRVSDKDSRPTGLEDITLRFAFKPPVGGQQSFNFTAIRNGNSKTVGGMKTTPLNAPPTIHTATIGGQTLQVFAGLREDPFFFDVEQFFRVRAGALGIGPAVGFRPANNALDFAKGYNVNTIVVRVPRAFLQSKSGETTFDVWETIAVNDGSGQFKQVERLGRPGVNEGLIVKNNLLNIFNSVPPSVDLTPAAAPVRAEAKKTLLALGNDSARADALLTAFLPDVMRIDTTQPSGYLNATNALGAPITGRKLLDDVIDNTLTVLTNGAITKDNVSYAGPGGNPAQGHNPLVKRFPYLAKAN
ncbi:MAG: DUF4331 domain-containing protein [Thermosynechococcaceae cyanobacterium]